MRTASGRTASPSMPPLPGRESVDLSGSWVAKPSPLSPMKWHDVRRTLRRVGTYASAAAKAHRLGLVSAEGARRVLDAVEREMREDRANVRPGGRNEALLLDELREARESLGLLSGPRSALGGAFWSLRRVQGGLFKKKRTDYFQLEER